MADARRFRGRGAASTALIAALALVSAGCGPSAERLRLRRQVAVVEAAVRAFERDCGRPPSEREGLLALVRKPLAPDVAARWKGPYLTPSQTRDSGERLFAYAVVERSGGAVEWHVWGKGLDGVAYTADDVWPAADPNGPQRTRGPETEGKSQATRPLEPSRT